MTNKNKHISKSDTKQEVEDLGRGLFWFVATMLALIASLGISELTMFLRGYDDNVKLRVGKRVDAPAIYMTVAEQMHVKTHIEQCRRGYMQDGTRVHRYGAFGALSLDSEALLNAEADKVMRDCLSTYMTDSPTVVDAATRSDIVSKHYAKYTASGESS